MGLQSATVRRLGQISTTYLTSTLTHPTALNAPAWVPAAILIPIAVVLTAALWPRRPPRAR